jgi:inner membrane protein
MPARPPAPGDPVEELRDMHPFSPAQVVGYVALVLGVSGFLQRDDRRLKLLVACECFVYVVHFTLLGRPPAASSALVSGVRTLLSVRFRSAWLAAASVAVNVGLAVALSTRGAGWIPVVGSSLGAIAVFTMRGVPMRLVLLASTSLWLANNVLSRSLGGTVLESLIAATSISTILRMTLAERAAAGERARSKPEGATP